MIFDKIGTRKIHVKNCFLNINMIIGSKQENKRIPDLEYPRFSKVI